MVCSIVNVNVLYYFFIVGGSRICSPKDCSALGYPGVRIPRGKEAL